MTAFQISIDQTYFNNISYLTRLITVPDNINALGEHLEQRNLAQRGGGHAFLLHLQFEGKGGAPRKLKARMRRI